MPRRLPPAILPVLAWALVGLCALTCSRHRSPASVSFVQHWERTSRVFSAPLVLVAPASVLKSLLH